MQHHFRNERFFNFLQAAMAVPFALIGCLLMFRTLL
jgi:hypothetical protein